MYFIRTLTLAAILSAATRGHSPHVPPHPAASGPKDADAGRNLLRLAASPGPRTRDAHPPATRASGARVSFLHPGSVRGLIEYGDDGVVAYGALFRAQPFGNNLVTLALTGRQIEALLEQQWLPARQQSQMLQASRGCSDAYDLRKPIGSRVLAETVRLDGGRSSLRIAIGSRSTGSWQAAGTVSPRY